MAAARDVVNGLQAGRVAPVYLLLGDDEAAKDPVLRAFDALVPDDVRGFNLERLHASDPDFDLGAAIAAARTLPFLGGRRVVQLRHAERLLKPKGRASAEGGEPDEGDGGAGDEGGEQAADLAELESYLQHPSPDTCLVLVASDLHRGTRLGRLLLKQAVVVEFWGLAAELDGRGPGGESPRDRAERFVRDAVSARGLRIEPEALRRIVEHGMGDIAALRGDIERVLTYCAGRARITEEDVRAVVRGSVVESDWKLVDAIADSNAKEALHLLRLMLDGGGSPYMILGQLGWFVRTKLPMREPGRVPAAVRSVFETDLAMKTSGGDPQVLLERLVVELCGRGGGGRAGASAPARPTWRGR